MYYLYILRSLVKDRYYIGSSENAEKRLSEHNSGKTASTKPYVPWQLVFKKSFLDRKSAVRQELKLKSYKNRQIISQIILDGYIKGH